MYPDATVAAAFPTRQRSRATATESTAAVATAIATAIAAAIAAAAVATAIAAAAVAAATTVAGHYPPFRRLCGRPQWQLPLHVSLCGKLYTPRLFGLVHTDTRVHCYCLRVDATKPVLQVRLADATRPRLCGNWQRFFGPRIGRRVDSKPVYNGEYLRRSSATWHRHDCGDCVLPWGPERLPVPVLLRCGVGFTITLAAALAAAIAAATESTTFPTRQRSRATTTESTAAVATAIATAIAAAAVAAAVTTAVAAAIAAAAIAAAVAATATESAAAA